MASARRSTAKNEQLTHAGKSRSALRACAGLTVRCLPRESADKQLAARGAARCQRAQFAIPIDAIGSAGRACRAGQRPTSTERASPDGLRVASAVGARLREAAPLLRQGCGRCLRCLLIDSGVGARVWRRGRLVVWRLRWRARGGRDHVHCAGADTRCWARRAVGGPAGREHRVEHPSSKLAVTRVRHWRDGGCAG